MKRRLTAALLSLALLLSLPAYAAGGSGSMANFTPALSYDGRFVDVDTDDWFYDNVAQLYALGLAKGQSDTYFGARDNITVKEVLSFAARVNSLYLYGDAEHGASLHPSQDGQWHTPYILYLKAQGLIDNSFDSLMDTSATRAQAAHIMACALPESEFTEINATTVTIGYATRSFITDVNDYTPYQQDILQLYKWGILTGSDDTGAFLPSASITRSEFAALLTRLVDPDLRVTLGWDVSAYYTVKSKSYRDLVTPGTYHRTHDPADTDAIDSNIRYMLANGSNTITVYLPNSTVTESSVTTLMNRYLNAIRHYIEQGYNAVSCSYSAATGRISLRFYSSIFSDELFITARSKTLDEAIRVHDELWAQGKLAAGMSELEKARVYYTWVCENTVYDFRAVDSSLSHTAYSLFSMGTAVCDGYTAAYNLLLKLEGIPCTTYSLGDHIWTVATLDGQQVHIDTTWGSQSGTINYTYFAMTPAESLARF